MQKYKKYSLKISKNEKEKLKKFVQDTILYWIIYPMKRLK